MNPTLPLTLLSYPPTNNPIPHSLPQPTHHSISILHRPLILIPISIQLQQLIPRPLLRPMLRLHQHVQLRYLRFQTGYLGGARPRRRRRRVHRSLVTIVRAVERGGMERWGLCFLVGRGGRKIPRRQFPQSLIEQLRRETRMRQRGVEGARPRYRRIRRRQVERGGEVCREVVIRRNGAVCARTIRQRGLVPRLHDVVHRQTRRGRPREPRRRQHAQVRNGRSEVTQLSDVAAPSDVPDDDLAAAVPADEAGAVVAEREAEGGAEGVVWWRPEVRGRGLRGGGLLCGVVERVGEGGGGLVEVEQLDAAVFAPGVDAAVGWVEG